MRHTVTFWLKQFRHPSHAHKVRLMGWMVIVVIILGSWEVFSWLTLSLLEGRFMTYAALDQEQASALTVDEGSATPNMNVEDREIVNPYYGVSLRSGERTNLRPYGQEQLADYGFEDDAGPLMRSRSKDHFIINITGGSVARGFLDWGGREALRDELAKLPALKGKEIVFSSTAFYGHKEPQQLLALNYLLTLGGTFDMVIAIDGFNEITMPKVYNEGAGASPFYPWGWYGRLWQLNSDPQQMLLRAEGTLAQEQRSDLAAAFRGSFVGRTMAGGLLWKVFDQQKETKINESRKALTMYQPTSSLTGVVDSGPMPSYKNTDDYLQDQVSIWESGTRQLARLTHANDMHFISILQPNQYASKHIMTSTEKDVAWDDAGPFKPLVEQGYPLLRKAGERLRNEGITFMDFSDIFDTTKEQVFTDNCCHFNAPFGNAILAKRLASAIAEDLQTHPL